MTTLAPIVAADFKIVPSCSAARPFCVITLRRKWNVSMGTYRTEVDANARIRSLVKQQRCPVC